MFLKQWFPSQLRLQLLNRLSGGSWFALPLWKEVQPQALVAARQDFGTYSDIAMVVQVLGLSGPMGQGHLMTIETYSWYFLKPWRWTSTECRLATICEHHKGVTKWISNFWDESNMSANNKFDRIHCEAGSMSVSLAFESRMKCQDFCCSISRWWYLLCNWQSFLLHQYIYIYIIVRQSQSIEDGTSASNWHPCGGCWPTNPNFSSLMKTKETGLENLRSNLLPLECGLTLTLVAIDLCVLGVSLEELQRVLSLKPARPNAWRMPFRFFVFSPYGGSRRLFQRFPFFDGFYTLFSCFAS